jgi:hypothetical protein
LIIEPSNYDQKPSNISHSKADAEEAKASSVVNSDGVESKPYTVKKKPPPPAGLVSPVTNIEKCA